MIWSRSKVEVKGQGTLRRVLVARFADLPGQNTFPGFEIFPVARLSEFPGFVVFPGSIFPVVSRFLASGQLLTLRKKICVGVVWLLASTYQCFPQLATR